MSVLNVNDLKKILGAREILRGVSFRIERGEKLGVVGRNGEGKTTLLRLIEGEEHPDAGSVTLSKDARIGYVVQRPEFDAGMTVKRYVEGGLQEVHDLMAEIERVGEAMGDADGDELDSLVHRHGELTARMDMIGGWEADRSVETVLTGIGLGPEFWDRDPNTLSGGEKSRTALARELVSVPDLLLLDEPTNHLDVAGIEWLEAYLNEIKSAVLIVSHDRRLLDRVADVILEVERGNVNRYPGNYTKYVVRKEERYQEEYRAWEQQQDYIRREENFIKKHMGSQRTAEAKGRKKKLSHVVRLHEPFNDVRRPVIKMAQVERGGEQVLETIDLAIGYDDKVLAKDINVRIGRGEKVGIIGPNGAGKTTLLKVLAGQLPPKGGTIHLGYRAVCGYYDQEVSDLRDDGTPYTEIRRDHPQMTDLEIRSHLAKFLFRGDDIDKSVASLSGGERGRLSLARLVLTGPSWLALDEPTNHLDLAARTALEEMLSAFPGALLCVSHDRAFLDSIVHTIFEFSPEGVRTFRGNYSDYRAKIVAEEEAALEQAQQKERAAKAARVAQAEKEAKAAAQRNAQNAKPSGGGKGNAKADAKSANAGANSAKKKPNNPWRLEKLENAIIELEKKRDETLAQLSDPNVYKDVERMKEAQFALAEIERDLEEKNEEWELYAG